MGNETYKEQLRFGLFVPPQHPLGENPSLLFERDLEVVSMCDRLGFEEAWIGLRFYCSIR